MSALLVQESAPRFRCEQEWGVQATLRPEQPVRLEAAAEEWLQAFQQAASRLAAVTLVLALVLVLALLLALALVLALLLALALMLALLLALALMLALVLALALMLALALALAPRRPRHAMYQQR